MAEKKEYPHPHGGHRKRLKERFLREGLSNFQEHEILELILFYAIPQKDTNELAHSLIDRFDGLKQTLSADWRELKKCSGISDHSATLLKLIYELQALQSKRSLKKPLNCNDREAVGAYLIEWFQGIQEERLVAIFLDASGNKIGDVLELSCGDIRHVVLPTLPIMEGLALRHASAFIIAHNHPDGALKASRSDCEVTEKLYRIFAALGTPLREHYLIAGEKFLPLVSFMQDNLQLQ